ncbi:nucleoside triphosphate pyrophosphohydrolase [Halobacillus naozhouensis]|uniref:Nucleoside triphosphate pyrophosphohydrolase n=1 Tax=Halobacillus naozhouensis TaxID=554880 RepID=A0ABY8IZ61_9BACI|nr:nucleoside triphosphate pyrophosphohydrolase [Halobacillus naozhouensis]WFT75498.1 nucleoside triphosphate pyrophosphohydrolase [Halobacillus naozhouensis]
MPVYHKLVRDQIPEIIDGKGKTFHTCILNESEYIGSLRDKLEEELNEYLTAESDKEALGELADLLELIDAASKTHGSSLKQVEKIRREKFEQRGGFDGRVFLVEAED